MLVTGQQASVGSKQTVRMLVVTGSVTTSRRQTLPIPVYQGKFSSADLTWLWLMMIGSVAVDGGKSMIQGMNGWWRRDRSNSSVSGEGGGGRGGPPQGRRWAAGGWLVHSVSESVSVGGTAGWSRTQRRNSPSHSSTTLRAPFTLLLTSASLAVPQLQHRTRACCCLPHVAGGKPPVWWGWLRREKSRVNLLFT